jgi:hypothetical protein
LPVSRRLPSNSGRLKGLKDGIATVPNSSMLCPLVCVLPLLVCSFLYCWCLCGFPFFVAPDLVTQRHKNKTVPKFEN